VKIYKDDVVIGKGKKEYRNTKKIFSEIKYNIASWVAGI
jgi:hypothetical protein